MSSARPPSERPPAAAAALRAPQIRPRLVAKNIFEVAGKGEGATADCGGEEECRLNAGELTNVASRSFNSLAPMLALDLTR